MNIKAFLEDWILNSNNFDTVKYLDKYLEAAVLSDPSVGRIFEGHKAIEDYFTTYFIAYKTNTEILKLIAGDNTAHLEVAFTGEFPEGKINGMFDFIFKDGKIASVKADLM